MNRIIRIVLSGIALVACLLMGCDKQCGMKKNDLKVYFDGMCTPKITEHLDVPGRAKSEGRLGKFESISLAVVSAGEVVGEVDCCGEIQFNFVIHAVANNLIEMDDISIKIITISDTDRNPIWSWNPNYYRKWEEDKKKSGPQPKQVQSEIGWFQIEEGQWLSVMGSTCVCKYYENIVFNNRQQKEMEFVATFKLEDDSGELVLRTDPFHIGDCVGSGCDSRRDWHSKWSELGFPGQRK